ncbi:MAG: hypothetical protein PHQ86_04815, partial [Dehalococcoidales bacterium]|nr:hypothetical protein [Dehalococcoidales bacterium]
TDWERIFTNTPANIDSFNLVKLTPQYNNDNQLLLLAGISSGNSALWESTDNGQSFNPPHLTNDSITSTSFNIDIWAIVNEHTVFIGSFDPINNHGLLYCTTDSGLTYSAPTVVGNYSLGSITLSPNYDQDKTILSVILMAVFIGLMIAESLSNHCRQMLPHHH